MGHTLASPLEGIFVAIEGSSLAGLVSAELNPSPEGLLGPLFLKGVPRVINLEKEGDAFLLHEQVALLNSREVKLLSKCKTARAEAVWLREELEASRALVEHLQCRFRRALFDLWPSRSIFTAMFIGAGKSTNTLTTPRVDTCESFIRCRRPLSKYRHLSSLLSPLMF
ncbi:hypothetical protein ACLOJK_034947 [Asimina triloba]